MTFIRMIALLSLFVSCVRKNELRIVKKYSLPIEEISGMCWRKNPQSGSREIVFVSDKDFSVYTLDWDKIDKGLNVKKHALASHPSEPDKANGSQWESVYSDSSGRVYVLQEHPSKIFVTDPALSRIERSLTLKYRDDSEENEEMNNSKGEGILLLNNGHFIVVKEKRPTKLMEFSWSADKSPSGITPQLILNSNKDSFNHEMYASHHAYEILSWPLASLAEKGLEDSSGINAGPTSNLYLLSDKGQSIVKIERDLSPGTMVKFTKVYALPSMVEKAEGMVVDSDHGPIIGIDSKKTQDFNLFKLSPLE